MPMARLRGSRAARGLARSSIGVLRRPADGLRQRSVARAPERAGWYMRDVQPPPLDPRWLPLIDAVARRTLGPQDRTGAALADEIARLSERYTRRGGALREAAVERAARLRFFVPRDLPKIGGPLAELAAVGALPRERRWRVLDVGAGLGTTTLGAGVIASALGVPGLDVVALEREPALVDGMSALVLDASEAGLVAPISLETRAVDLETTAFGTLTRGGPFDLILLGLCLNELYEGAPDPVEKRAHFVDALAKALAPGGALIVLEPALSETTRALMAIRDALVERGRGIFAPCPPSTARCPLLTRERDWCHEDLPLALPAGLAAVAKQAGLRFEGLTYSYLTLREGASLAEQLGGHARVVGGPVKSKGKSELLLCAGGHHHRLTVLDRKGIEPLAAARGSVLAIEPVPVEPASLRWGKDVQGRAVRRVRA
jgi:SAM-dependent methyltransferase